MWAKQSTAATLIVGPILDSSGAEYTSAVIGDLSISKNGGTLTALAAAATLTHIANGQYTLVMTTGNLDTLGRLQITCNKSTYQMPPIGLVVVPAMVFDSMVLGTDVLQSDVTQFGGTAGTFAAGIPTAALDSATQTQLDSIETDVAALAAAGEITITSPVVDMGADGLPVKIEIVQGADYLLADSTQIAMSLTGTFPAWTSASAYLDILCGGVELSLTGTITTATGGTRALYFELTATQSATLVDSTKDTPSQDIGVFDLRVVLSNTHVTYPINRGKFVSRRRSQA